MVNLFVYKNIFGHRLMVYGVRTGVPFALGLLASLVFSFLFVDNDDYMGIVGNGYGPSRNKCSRSVYEKPDYIYSSEHWNVKRTAVMPSTSGISSGKVIRSKFAATELGIRDKLAVIILGQSSLSVALSALIAVHVPRVQIFVDVSRIDQEMSTMANLVPFRQNGQHSHISVLNSILNLTLHESYDWFLLVPDSTYVNPFALVRLVERLNWNSAQAIGQPYEDGKCQLKSGILLSNPALQLLIQERSLCNSITASSDHLALEMCIQHATNLSCRNGAEGLQFLCWHFDDAGGESGLPIHERVRWFATSKQFNASVTVFALLSDLDAKSLHEHFLQVEMDRTESKIRQLADEVAGAERHFVDSLKEDGVTVDEPMVTWPEGIPSPITPINRYQVPVWEYFTETHLFKNWPNNNAETLSDDDALDINEVLAAARAKVMNEFSENDGYSMEFYRLRNGYRSFNALRGMDYVFDLEYRKLPPSGDANNNIDVGRLTKKENFVLKRVHLNRPIYSTELLDSVPYVKEDTDVTLLVPVESTTEVDAARQLIMRHGNLCAGGEPTAMDNRQTRMVIAARNIDAATARQLNNDLLELAKRCKSWHTDATLLLLKLNNNGYRVEIAALDEAVDHYGKQMIYILMSPFADYQREFLDRVRIGTIRHYQAFFPIPFAEFDPLVVNADEIWNMTIAAVSSGGQSPSVLGTDFPTEGELLNNLGGDLTKKLGLMDRMLTSLIISGVKAAARINDRSIVVHKDHGIFDLNDFQTVSVYGTDYITVRERRVRELLDETLKERGLPPAPPPDAPVAADVQRLVDRSRLDLVEMFVRQSDLHVLRAVEPSLRIRYFRRDCRKFSGNGPTESMERCVRSARATLGTKSLIANLMSKNLRTFNNESGEQHKPDFGV